MSNRAVAIFALCLLLVKSTHSVISCSNTIPPDTKCARIPLNELDASLAAVPWNYAFFVHGVQVSTSKEGAQIYLPDECDYRNLDPLHQGKQLLTFNVSRQRQPACKLVSGTWLLADDGRHSQQNMFEELGKTWYPAYLATRHACMMDKSAMRITHIGGTRRGWLAFDDVYRSLATYMPYEMLQAGGGIWQADTVTGCLEFETAVLVQASYSWHTKPISNHYNQRLAGFAHTITEELGVGHIKPHKCKKQMTIVLRKREYRNITNMDAIAAAVRKKFPEVQLVLQDMAGIPFKEQLELVRKTDVLVFQHGGAGPLVIFLPQGAAVVELFPYGFADPLYRNMAVMTNHVYFVWQNKDINKAQDLARMKRDSNTEVDIPSLLVVLQSAVHAVAATTYDSYLSYEGTILNTTLCPWCGAYSPSSCKRE